MTVDVRFLEEDDRPEFQRSIVRAFGGDHEPDAELDARFAASFPTETSIAAFDDDQMVGTFSSFDFNLRVPGNEVAMAATTVVSVLPTHRRRGLLSRMMELHLRQAIDRGQPVAALWATEYGIYSRFGYGPASEWREVGFDARKTSIAPEPGVALKLIDTDAARSIVPAIFDAATATRPGSYERPDWYWEHRVFMDHKEFREGQSKQRWVVASIDGEPVGYVRYRTKLDWNSEGPEGKVSVIELITDNDAARRALWQFVSTVDLFPNVTYWNAPADDVLPWILSDPRQLTHSIAEALWVRILDVASALEARSYTVDGSIVLGLDDAFLPELSGSYRLTVSDGSASVKRTADTAEVSMSIDQLGTLYLGTHRAQMLSQAGRLSGSTESIALLDRLMAWPVPAWTEAIF